MVVEASRRFVCIRPATYESAKEAPFLEALFRTGSGELENTTFAILAPDGRTKLCRTGRTAEHAFPDSVSMADFMNRTADRYDGSQAGAPLPTIPTLRLALDEAACDQRPLVLVAAPSGRRLATMESLLAELAWSEEFVGRFRYSSQVGGDGLGAIGAEGETGYLVVQAGEYGLDGEVLARVAATADREAIGAALRKALAGLEAPEPKDYRDHMRRGIQMGLEWETAIPVTDPHANDRPTGPPPRR